MSPADTNTEVMSPAEHAALVRDAITLVNAVETGITRTGAVFASASALTVANLALGLRPVAEVLAAVAALAFLAAVVLVVTRISLGPAPEPPARGVRGRGRGSAGSAEPRYR